MATASSFRKSFPRNLYGIVRANTSKGGIVPELGGVSKRGPCQWELIAISTGVDTALLLARGTGDDLRRSWGVADKDFVLLRDSARKIVLILTGDGSLGGEPEAVTAELYLGPTEEANRSGVAGKEIYRRNYTAARMMMAYKALYEKLAANVGTASAGNTDTAMSVTGSASI